MFEEFESLKALKKHETLALAGAHLHVEASTVWKRIQALEKLYGFKLLEKKGRNALLTPQAERLLVEAEPHLLALKELLYGFHPQETPQYARPLRVGLSESLALSWGPSFLSALSKEVPHIFFELSTHRGSLLIEKLRHGDFDFILCAGSNIDKETLLGELLFEEELFLYKAPHSTLIYSIEESALSFEWLREESQSLFRSLRKKHQVHFLQSYGAIASLIISGMAGGLIPSGIADRFRVPEKWKAKTTKRLFRPIYLYSKKGFYTSQLGNKIFSLSRRITSEIKP